MTTSTMHPDSLAERYAQVCDKIARAAAASGRRENDVFLVAVTKNAEPEQIRQLIDLGHRDLGENRVQQLMQHAALVDEYFNRLKVLPSLRRSVDDQQLFPMGEDKLPALASSKPSDNPVRAETKRSGIRWHMIGHLQRNKARKIVDLVRLVHSVDSLRIAEELQTIALRRDCVIDVLLQVNCSGETSKFGCPVPAALPMAEQIETMINIRLRGVMTIAADGASERDTRATFARCRDIYEEIRTQGLGEGRCNLLSMGMSNDYELAIKEGANIVRVGSAIFGASTRPDAPDEPEPEEPDEETT
jgi:pyridoxal phosphate enzyme (YggS family)